MVGDAHAQPDGVSACRVEQRAQGHVTDGLEAEVELIGDDDDVCRVGLVEGGVLPAGLRGDEAQRAVCRVADLKRHPRRPQREGERQDVEGGRVGLLLGVGDGGVAEERARHVCGLCERAGSHAQRAGPHEVACTPNLIV